MAQLAEMNAKKSTMNKVCLGIAKSWSWRQKKIAFGCYYL
jgi:hypothetical protein